MTKSGNWRCSSFSLIQRITRFQLHLVTAIARVRSLSYSREIHKFNFSWRSVCPVQGWLDMRFWPRPGDAWCSKCRGKNAACKDCFSTFSVFSFIVVHIVVSSSSLFLPKFMARESQTRGGGVWGVSFLHISRENHARASTSSWNSRVSFVLDPGNKRRTAWL